MPIDPRLMPVTPEGRNADRFASQRRAVESLQRGQINTRQYAEDLTTLTIPAGWLTTAGPELTIEVNAPGKWIRAWMTVQLRATSTVSGSSAARWAVLHDSLDYPPGFTGISSYEGAVVNVGNTFGPVGPTAENFVAESLNAQGLPNPLQIASVEYPASVGTHRLFMSYFVDAASTNRQTRNRRLWAEVF